MSDPKKASEMLEDVFQGDMERASSVLLSKAISLVEKLELENEKLKEALRFYANEMNYSIDDCQGVSGEMRRRCVLYKDLEERNDVYSYAGYRARAVLKEIEGSL